jgi:hypothetical protein
VRACEAALKTVLCMYVYVYILLGDQLTQRDAQIQYYVT